MMENNSRGNGEEEVAAAGAVRVPPGFRFHPTDEELLYYYLRKKVSYEPIDLDVIREIDLNKLEPWDLKDKCSIGSGPQNEWYFFSHKDKKYPTGTRTNRATAAGFWKATGRDKAIHHSADSKTIGMRKTLVFYTGRAPHGHKTDWIMHEYRLHDDLIIINSDSIQEEGWVICRVFKKKVHTRSGFHPYQDDDVHGHGHHPASDILPPNGAVPTTIFQDHHHHHHQHKHMINNLNLPNLFDNNNGYTNTFLDDHIAATNPSMHLPQLLSPDIPINSIPCPAATALILSSLDPLRQQQHHQQQLIIAAAGGSGTSSAAPAAGGGDKLSGDWSFLDKLLAANHGLQDQIAKCTNSNPPQQQVSENYNHLAPLQAQRFLPFPNCHNFDEPEFSRFPK